MQDSATANLVKLGDSDLTVADSAEDVRGRKTVDSSGEEVGKVKSLLIDDEETKVRFLEVESGGFLGMGAETRLVPVDAIANITDDEVVVDRTREDVHGSPRYDPEVVYDADYYSGTYGYYGYMPYWGMGYAYPAYPYYRR